MYLMKTCMAMAAVALMLNKYRFVRTCFITADVFFVHI